MPKTIDSFSKEYAFLSNFYASPVVYQRTLFATVEHAYQAAKSKKPQDHKDIALMLFPGQAKKHGQKLKLRSDWEDIKLKVMLVLVRRKFEIPALADALKATGTAKLIEGNYWNDTFWGVCKGEGENHLGKILMKVRKELTDDGD